MTSIISSPSSPYRALTMLLLGLSLLAVLGGISALFATKWMLLIGTTWITSSTVVPEILLKGFGAVAIAIGYLLFSAAKDPVRNIAAINAFILLMILAVAVELYATFWLGLTDLYPPTLVWGSIALRTTLAAALLALRPRQTE